MGLFIRQLPGFCILFMLFSVLINTQWSPDDHSASTRRARNVPPPDSINCKLGRWSPWTPCTSCTERSFRARRLEKPSQFGGDECIEALWEKQRCPDRADPCMVVDYCGDKFTCNTTGRCISQSLRCNDVQDCEDFSDEDDCVEFNRRNDYCSSLLSIPGAKNGIQGYNIITDEFVDPVLDPYYYGESCEYIYNGEWNRFTYDAFCERLTYNAAEKNYRKPYNYHTYQFVAEAAAEGTHEYYEDAATYLKARQRDRSGHAGVTVGVAYVEVGLKASGKSKFLNNVTQYQSQDVGFIRLFSKIQTALFKMRSSDLMLHEDMLVDLMALPEVYDYGMYSRFINTYGTHFVTEGAMGGTLEHVIVVDKKASSYSETRASEIGGCLGASIGIAAPIKGAATLGLTAKTETCGNTGSYDGEREHHSADIKDVLSLVQGGVTVTASGVMVVKDPETYRKWGASIKYYPVLVDYEVMPIFELVRRSTSAEHVGPRIDNLQRGFDEYMQEFDPCRCSPCLHRGVPILKGTSCSCECRSGYEGEACEKTERPDKSTDGAWSCWGPWSGCASGQNTRSRSCNNPRPSDGGLNCLGSSSQSRRC